MKTSIALLALLFGTSALAQTQCSVEKAAAASAQQILHFQTDLGEAFSEVKYAGYVSNSDGEPIHTKIIFNYSVYEQGFSYGRLGYFVFDAACNLIEGENLNESGTLSK